MKERLGDDCFLQGRFEGPQKPMDWKTCIGKFLEKSNAAVWRSVDAAEEGDSPGKFARGA